MIRFSGPFLKIIGSIFKNKLLKMKKLSSICLLFLTGKFKLFTQKSTNNETIERHGFPYIL